ncbi:Bifunctional purine biosynthesis protein PurH [Entomophthora muscae]|uniref:Bifunctional purine biosynthesis protein PurH n=2 Tax=Entomophthora muscae TaxID=34485 RepID=A0ACC2ULZ6_9FUNG|nr:Bifunctional purine biosynthesis protein PurH [Entomophthora muscae]KAJ9087786.1 Bifunctional purine biosynthesis protein PurH [Entomophthora muscae]
MSKAFKHHDSVSDQSDPMDSSNKGLDKYLIATAFIAALSTFNSGLNSSVANIPEKTIHVCKDAIIDIYGLPSCLDANATTWGLVTAMFALGGGFGALTCGQSLQMIGRKNTLMANNLLFILGGLLIATSREYGQFGVGRFIVGLASGAASVSVSTYIGEVSPNKGRGAMGTVLQLMTVVGILVAQIISLFMNKPDLWRFLFALTVIPSALQIVLLFLCVESPRFLASKNNFEGARTSLAKLRSGFNIDNELSCILDGQRGSKGEGEVEKPPTMVESTRELFADKVQFKYLMMAFTLHALQQLSGINAAIFFSTSYLTTALGNEEYATYGTIGMGVLNLIVTIISVFAVDRLGRKLLLLIALFGMTAMSVIIVIGAAFKVTILAIAGIVLFVGSFAIGMGSVPWLIMPEIFPTRTLAAASAMCMGLNWMCNFVVSFVFGPMADQLGDYTFTVFAVINALGFFFVLVFVPETKGRSIEEILGTNPSN